jgi:hypothetical protein
MVSPKFTIDRLSYFVWHYASKRMDYAHDKIAQATKLIYVLSHISEELGDKDYYIKNDSGQLSVRNVFNMFLTLDSNSYVRQICKDWYKNGTFYADGEAEFSLDSNEVEFSEKELDISNPNAVDIDSQDCELKDNSDLDDFIDDEVRELGWYTESVRAEMQWPSQDEHFVMPSEDFLVSWLYENDMEYETDDVMDWVHAKVDSIIQENKDFLENEILVEALTKTYLVNMSKAYDADSIARDNKSEKAEDEDQ